MIANMFWYIVLLKHLVSSTSDTDLIKASVGIRFTPMPRALIPTAGYATITFSLEKPFKPAMMMLGRQRCESRSDSVDCALSSEHSDEHLTSLTDSIYQQIMEKHDQLSLLLSGFQFREENLDKRALFEFVGSLSHTLFGTATDAELRKIYEHMKNISARASKADTDRETLHQQVRFLANKLESDLGVVVQTVNATASATAQLAGVISVIKGRLNELIQQSALHALTAHNLTRSIRLTQLVFQRFTIAQAAIQELNDWLEGVLTLQKGYLSQRLIPLTELSRALKRLQQWTERQPGQFKVYDDPAHLHLYYEMQSVRCIYMDRTLVVVMKVPYVASPRTYEVYRIRTFPVPLHGPTEIGQQGYTQVVNVPDYLAISKDRGTYAELSAGTYNYCTRKWAGFCMDLAVTYPLSHPSCVTATFLDYSHETVKDKCDFKVHTSPLKPQIQILNSTSYLLINNTQPVRVLCPQQTARHVSNGPIVVAHLPCGCKLSLPHTTIDEASGGCTTNMKLAAMHPLNFALFAHFNLTKYLQHPPTNVVKHTIPRVDLPNLQALTRLTHRLQNTDHRYGAAINTIAKQAVEIQDTAELDSLNYDLAELDPEFWTWKTLSATLGASFWAFIVTVILVIMGYKLYALSAIVAVTHGKPAHAYVVTTFTPPRETVPLNIWWHEDIMVQLVLVVVVSVLAGYALFSLGIMVMKLWKRAYLWCPRLCKVPQKTDSLDIFLKLSNLQESVILYLTSIEYEEGFTTIVDTPACVDARVRLGTSTLVMLNWDKPLVYLVNGHERSKRLPRRVQVTSDIGATVGRITFSIQKTCVSCSLLCKLDKLAGYISIPCPITDAGFNPTTCIQSIMHDRLARTWTTSDPEMQPYALPQVTNTAPFKTDTEEPDLINPYEIVDECNHTPASNDAVSVTVPPA